MNAERTGDGECSLCGRGLPPSAVITGDGDSFCSTGCRDVADTLGSDDPAESTVATERWGENRRESPEKHTEVDEDGEDSSAACTRTFLRVDGMYSATCEAYLETVARKREGVIDAEASYVTETIRVDHEADRVSKSDLREALSTLGYTASLREPATTAAKDEREKQRKSNGTTGIRTQPDDQILEFRYAVGVLFGAFLLLPYVAIIYPVHLATLVDWGPLDMFAGAFQLGNAGGIFFLRFYLLLVGVILLFTGLPVLRGAYISLKMRRPNTDLLVAITAVSAYLYSTVAVLLGRNDVFFDLTIVVAAAVTAAVYYESSIKQRALGRLTELTVSQVDTATLYGVDGSTTDVSVAELADGDRILVRQGERIPVDGMLAEGPCTVDEAVVTGESLPVSKQAGDDVVGGSIVTADAAIVEVGPGATSSIDRIRTAVWDLQSADHGVQRDADRLTGRIVGVVAGAAVLVGVAALALGSDVARALLLFLLVLLVGSPWALGLATPLSVATSLREALARGIVVFDETVFERLRTVDVVVFDKTGTLTTGEMRVVDADVPPDLLAMAAKLEQRASHPVAEAIVAAVANTGAGADTPRADGGPEDGPDDGTTMSVSEFRSHAAGVEGMVAGSHVLVGNRDLFAEQGWTVSDAIESRVDDARGFGRLPVIVGRDGTAEGVIVVGDEPRDGWEALLERLGAAGTDVVLLTGDDEAAADLFGRHDAVTHVFADVPPAGKTAAIRRLAADGRVAMVGEGTNDAPALAAADLGITLGSGTALAAEAADIAIAHDEIGAVETAFDIARASGRRVRLNNRVALAYNGIAITAVAGGVFNPLTAIVAVGISGGLVVANSSRTLVDQE